MAEDPGLTPEQRQQIQAAQERAATFMGATKVAAFNGWTIGFFAAVSIASGLFSLTGLVVGLGLAVVARNEFLGRTRVRALDPAGFELLWRNQIGLLTLIAAYCGWSLLQTYGPPDPQMAELTDLLGEGTDDLVRSLTRTLYVAVAATTGIFQGLNARYYRIRGPRLQEYLAETPAWVVDLQRAARID